MSENGIKKHAHLMKQLYNHKTPRDQSQLYALKIIEKSVIKQGKRKVKVHFCSSGMHGIRFEHKPGSDVLDFLKGEGYAVSEVKEVGTKDLDIGVTEEGRPRLEETETKCWEIDVELPGDE